MTQSAYDNIRDKIQHAISVSVASYFCTYRIGDNLHIRIGESRTALKSFVIPTGKAQDFIDGKPVDLVEAPESVVFFRSANKMSIFEHTTDSHETLLLYTALTNQLTAAVAITVPGTAISAVPSPATSGNPEE